MVLQQAIKRSSTRQSEFALGFQRAHPQGAHLSTRRHDCLSVNILAEPIGPFSRAKQAISWRRRLETQVQ
jgi:hypothetical protein